MMCSLELAIPQSAPNMSTTFCSNHTTIKKTFPLSSCSINNLTQSCKTKSSPLLRLRLAGKQKCGVSRNDTANIKLESLPEGLDPELMPKHVAVIMDGNRRWAKNRGLPPQHGHRAGLGEAFKKLCRNCLKYGVKVVTVYAFSIENYWVRQQDEVEYLMELFQEVFTLDYMELTQEDGVRLSFVGNRERLPEELQRVMRETEEATKGNKKMQVVVAVNYSGQYDITEATKRIARKVRDGVLEVEDIDEGVFEKHLETYLMEFPNPDLMIRSSGELRVSNFMLWQLAYTELFFTEKMFPDFDHTDLIHAFAAFQKRQRRFGGN